MDLQIMIDDFVEGVLNPEKELELFHALSNNPDLISDLKQLMALKMSIADDIMDNGPHPESINSITDQLGFSSSKPGFFTRYRQSFITSGIAGILFLLLQFTPDDSNLETDLNEIASNSSISSDASATSFQEDKTSSTPTFVHDTIYIDREKIVYLNSESAKKEEAKENKEDQTKKESIIEEDFVVKPFNGNVIQTPINDSFDSRGSNNTTSLVHYRSNSSDAKNSKHIFESSFTGFLNVSEIKQVNRDYQPLNNFNISYLYSLNEKYYVGLDYTRENFYQTFFNVSNDQAFQYFQNPDFNTVSALIRYYLDYQIFENQDYYVQFDLGLPINENFNFAGLSNRFTFGIQHEITNSFYLKSNINYSTLFFRQNNLIYDTSKFGFNIGAGFKL